MKILFIGNSHTYFNDMPALFGEICEELGCAAPEITMLAFSNRSLEWHCKEYFPVRFALLYGHYDFCVIQQYGHPFPGYEKTAPYLKKLVELCRNVQTMPILIMTWPKKNSPELFTETAADYRKLAADLSLPLIPIGELFVKLTQSHPEIDLYHHDGSHASPFGSYLIAASLAAFILRPNDLSALSDRSHDFHAHFVSDGIPNAYENRSEIPCQLMPDSACILRKAVEERILSQA